MFQLIYFSRISIIQNGKEINILNWKAAAGVMEKVFKPNVSDWDGLIWMANTSTVPKDSPDCGWKNELCHIKSSSTLYNILIIMLVFIVVVVLSSLSFMLIMKQKYHMATKEIESVMINWENMKEKDGNLSHNDETDNMIIYKYNDLNVVTKHLKISSVDLKDKQVFLDILHMKEVRHVNINPFVGICPKSPNVCIVMEYARRGSLRDIIQDQSIQFDFNFKTSLLFDIASGMWYLHQSPVGAHGLLTSSKCVIDARWTCKITGHGLNSVRKGTFTDTNPLLNSPAKELWVAPELLALATEIPKISDKQKSDTYSFGIITQEVMQEKRPYGENDTADDQIIRRVQNVENPIFRPNIDDQKPKLQHLMWQCWQQDPNGRPTFNEICRTVYNIRKDKGIEVSLIDSIVIRLEVYTRTLEENVIEQTLELYSEKARVETILRELLPEIIACQLAKGERVHPEAFENITLFFSDIVGFTEIASILSALEIVSMLNELYSKLDDVLYMFDVYKIATIGDSYMVASGVPIRNGKAHAYEICNMALSFIGSVKRFMIPNIENNHLQIRIGIHSGPCVAGVAGVKMPRYMLFGHTVDIASRMESAGQAMKIHISESTQNLIMTCNEFEIVNRGQFYMKNDLVTTYWLSEKVPQL